MGQENRIQKISELNSQAHNAVQVLNKVDYDSDGNPIGMSEDSANPYSANFGTVREPLRGGCYKGDGQSYIESSVPVQTYNEFSLSLWYKRKNNSSTETYQVIFNIYGWDGFNFHETTSNGELYCGTSLNDRFGPTEIGSINIDTWYHFIYTRDSQGNAKFFKDGNLIASKIQSSNPFRSGFDFKLLVHYNISSFSHGLLFNVSIYDKVLTTDDIKAIQRKGYITNGLLAKFNCSENSGDICYDSSGNGNHGQIINAITTTPEENPNSIHQYQDVWSFENEEGYGNGGLSFNGITDYTVIPYSNTNILYEFLIEINVSWENNNQSYQTLFALTSIGTQTLPILLRVINNEFQLYSYGTTHFRFPFPPENTYIKYTFQLKDGVFKFFMNNELLWETSMTSIRTFNSICLGCWDNSWDGTSFIQFGKIKYTNLEIWQNIDKTIPEIIYDFVPGIDKSILYDNTSNQNNGNINGATWLGNYLPKNSSILLPPFKDVLGNNLQYQGKVPGKAKFVESNCFQGDGINGGHYGQLTNDINISGDFVFSFSFVRLSPNNLWNSVLGSSDLTTDGNIYIWYKSSLELTTEIRIGFKYNGVATSLFYMNGDSIPLNINEIANVKLERIGTVITCTLNNKVYTNNTTDTLILSSDISFNRLFFGANTDAYRPEGLIWNIKVKNNQTTIAYWPLCEEINDPSTHIYHDVSGNGNHAQLINGTLANNGLQNKFHYLQKGFNLYNEVDLINSEETVDFIKKSQTIEDQVTITTKDTGKPFKTSLCYVKSGRKLNFNIQKQ